MSTQPTTTNPSPESALRTYWGYPAFRPLQREIIAHVLNGRDCLALLPTGGGKSLCYQVPAILMEGVCLVISPLIALMRDQVQGLKERGIEAEAIYSGMHIAEIDRILDNCIYGNVKLLYMSPERLTTGYAEARLKKMHISLIATDEAHCISQWGHDFRPAYRDLVQLREWHPETPVLALTASATLAVQEDIITALEMRDPAIEKGSFRRPNLSYLVYPREDKWQRMLDILARLPGSKLVYTRSRSKASQLAKFIGKQGMRCEAYHAGLPSAKRNKVQERWLEGITPVVVCTTAFGMGIDKPDVRTVIHYDLPGSLEEYYQEAGRAGRDGRQAFCVLLYDQSDIPQLMERCARAFPEVSDLVRVYRALCGYYQIPVGAGLGDMYPLEFRRFLDKYQLDAVHTYHCLEALEREGWIQMSNAVSHPSMVMIQADRDTLSTYQEEHPEHGELLRTLLRNYEGLFLDPVRIREADIAKLMGLKEKEVAALLHQLVRDVIVAYVPADDLPHITFLRERVEDRNLTFDTRLLLFLREQALHRAQSVVDYIGRTECREQYLLEYFGESTSEPCGNCDICRSLKKGVSYESVLLRIPGNGIALKDLVGGFSATLQTEVRSLLEVLEADELIALDGDLVRLQNRPVS